MVLPNGNYQAGVHISNVTHHVWAGTAINFEVANWSTCTYLVNKRINRLPILLTIYLCILKVDIDSPYLI